MADRAETPAAPAAASPTRRAATEPWLVALAAVVLAAGLAIALRGGLWRWIVDRTVTSQWLLVLLLFTVLLGVIGRQINGRWLGVLIDSRNKMSLSRLQVALWTLVVLSAYLTIAVPRIFDKPPAPTAFAQLVAGHPDDPILVTCEKRLGRKPASAAECDAGPLQITFPEELLLALGISMTSFAGSTLIQNSKKKKEVNLQAKDGALVALEQKRTEARSRLAAARDALNAALEEKNRTVTQMDDAIAAAAQRLAEATSDAEKKAAQAAQEQVQKQAEARKAAAAKKHADAAAAFEAAQQAATAADAECDKANDELHTATTEAEGLLHKNASPADASFGDLFRGEEIANYLLVDMSKVQMFFFTVVVVLAYGAAIGALLDDPRTLHNFLGVGFPPFSNSLDALLGISHGAYLSVKTVDQSKTTG